MNNFGDNLKRIRKEKGLKQKELAEKMGVSPVVISQYESNKRNPKIETVLKFQEALECDLENLGYKRDYWDIWHITPITKEEQTSITNEKILKAIEQLNDIGKEKVLTYIFDLLDNPKYKDNTPSF